MKTKITSDLIALTNRAALRHGKELSQAEANNHASKILEWMGQAEDGDEYGQDFWSAAKEYFLD